MSNPSAPRRAALAFIFVTVLIDMLAFGMIIPVLPTLVQDFMGGDAARAAQMYGVFGTAWALMQFIFSPVQGSLSDHFGRRTVILISCTGLGLDFILMALAPNLWWLLVGRVISGITAASFSTAGAYISDVTPPEKRAASFGLIGVAFGVGFVLGPAIGGILGDISPRLPFWASAFMALANVCWGLFVLPESLPKEKRVPFAWRNANPLGALKLLRSHPMLTGVAGSYFLINLAHVVLPSTTVLYMHYRFGWNTRAVGIMLAGVGISSLIVQGLLVKPAVKWLKERRAMALGLTTTQAYRYVLLPLAFRVILPPLTSEFLATIKNTSVAITIGLIELTGEARAMQEFSFQVFEAFTAATVMYLLVNIVVVTAMRFLERRVAIPGYISGK